jgi:hypothetical protein
METKERIRKAYEYLRSTGKIHTQQDVADIMGVKKENISRAFNGNKSYLTENFIKRFNNSFNEIFNIDWFLTGHGEMLNTSTVVIGDRNQGDVSQNGTMNKNTISISLPESGMQKIIKPNGEVEITPLNSKDSEYLELLKKKDEQIDKLILLLEKNMSK